MPEDGDRIGGMFLGNDDGLMQQVSEVTGRKKLAWGFVVSLLAHLGLVSLFLLHLPDPTPPPAPDDSIAVELVPPPPQPRSITRSPGLNAAWASAASPKGAIISSKRWRFASQLRPTSPDH